MAIKEDGSPWNHGYSSYNPTTPLDKGDLRSGAMSGVIELERKTQQLNGNIFMESVNLGSDSYGVRLDMGSSEFQFYCGDIHIKLTAGDSPESITAIVTNQGLPVIWSQGENAEAILPETKGRKLVDLLGVLQDKLLQLRQEINSARCQKKSNRSDKPQIIGGLLAPLIAGSYNFSQALDTRDE